MSTEEGPFVASVAFRQCELDKIVVAINDQQQRRVASPLLNARRLGPAIHQHAKALHVRIAPMLVLHFMTIGVDPGQILHAQLFIVFAGIEAITPQDGKIVAQCCQRFTKAMRSLPFSLISQFNHEISESWQ